MGENSLECEGKDELKVFSIFFNNRTRKYRVTQADSVMVDNVAYNAPFPEAINSIIKAAKRAGEKILKKDIKI